jgi:hypothetical protein
VIVIKKIRRPSAFAATHPPARLKGVEERDRGEQDRSHESDDPPNLSLGCGSCRHFLKSLSLGMSGR